MAQPDGATYSFIERPGDRPVHLNNAELELAARAVAAGLQARHLRGERLVLLLPPGRAFLLGFFGAVLAGMVPVPVSPLGRARASPDRLRSIGRIVTDCQAAAVVVAGAHAGVLVDEAPVELPSDVPVHRIEVLARGIPARWIDPEVGEDDTAFLQYTSGSTSDPRGVLVTHANLMANLVTIQRAFAMGPGDHGVIWLPPHHDMGLVGGLLAALASGFDVTCFPANDFVQSPVRWLRTITETRGTVSGGPDFAYRLCTERIRDDQLDGLDLTCWRVAFTGAEPVNASTIEAFTARFGAYGFDQSAFYPCYGLAESTLMVSGGDPSAAPIIRPFSRRHLDERARAQPPEDAGDRRWLVSCGRAVDRGSELLIVDPTTLRVHPPDHVAEIWVGGPSVAAGYAGRPEETDAIFGATTADGRGPFLRTGDLGFLADGELFVTGRLKDTIVVNGRTLHAPDVEDAVRSSLSVSRAGLTAALSIVDAGPEQLVVIQEVGRSAAPRAAEITRDIQAALARRFGVRAHEVVLTRVGAIPRTTSGKVRRLEAKARYRSGGLRLIDAAAGPTARESTHASPVGQPSLPGELLDLDRCNPDHGEAGADAEPGTGDAGCADA